MLHHLSVQLAEYQERVSQSHAPENSAAPPPAGAKEEGAEEELGGLPSSEGTLRWPNRALRARRRTPSTLVPAPMDPSPLRSSC